MSTIPTIVVTPSAAADAYGRVDRGEAGTGAGAGDFGATLQRALQGRRTISMRPMPSPWRR